MSPQRVAIVLSGHMRCWDQVRDNFKERFLDRYQPDVFISTYLDQAFWMPHEGRLGYKEDSPLAELDLVREDLKPIEMVVEDFLDLEPIFAERVKACPTYYHRPRNIVSMFYKIGAGMQLLEKHTMKTGQAYDMVIRMRPDMLINEPMPEFEPNIFYTLAHRNHMGGGTGDMFQIGPQETVLAFSKIGMYLEHIYQNTQLLCPHVASVEFIKMLGIPWKEFDVNKTIQHTPAGPYRAV
jgi:hypothetical protein